MRFNLKPGLVVAFDFDGVIHKYSKGWYNGSIYDGARLDILQLIKELQDSGIPCVIMTTRNPEEIREWWIDKCFDKDYTPVKTLSIHKMFYNDCKYLGITNRKIAAQAYIDDRAITYDGQSYRKLKEQLGL